MQYKRTEIINKEETRLNLLQTVAQGKPVNYDRLLEELIANDIDVDIISLQEKPIYIELQLADISIYTDGISANLLE